MADAWRPSANMEVLRRRATRHAVIRQRFARQGVLEVETPVLSTTTAPDPQVPSLYTQHQGSRYWLQPSPEHHMKRLLAAGSGSIFRLGSVFRDDPSGAWHSPEFSMLEWYRCGFDDQDLMQDVAELIAEIGGPADFGVRPYLELVAEVVGEDALDMPLTRLAALCAARGLQDTPGLSRDALLDFLMGVVIGPTLGRDQLQFVSHYPASQAALARLDPQQPRTARRFELYWRGVELANGFWELTDPREQAQRWEAELQQRQHSGAPVMEADGRLLQALQHGLPDCAGVALGLDRLHALLEGACSLSDVQSFSWDVA